MMTEDQIKKGFWYWDRENNFPPLSITNYDDYESSDKLNLNITQLNFDQKKQKEITKFWCENLHNLKSVKYLWYSSRVSQEMLEATCEMENLEGLYIKWSSIKQLNSLSKLKNLRHLYIGSSAQIEDIRIFRDINYLSSLHLEQLNKVVDFEDISFMTNLEGLGIDGSIWTSQKINNLNPLKNLTKLKYLTLRNTKILDKSFDPILNLKELVRFDTTFKYSKTEFEKLKKLPKLKYGNIEKI